MSPVEMTIEFWKRHAGEGISPETARQINASLLAFFRILESGVARVSAFRDTGGDGTVSGRYDETGRPNDN